MPRPSLAGPPAGRPALGRPERSEPRGLGRPSCGDGLPPRSSRRLKCQWSRYPSQCQGAPRFDAALLRVSIPRLTGTLTCSLGAASLHVPERGDSTGQGPAYCKAARAACRQASLRQRRSLVRAVKTRRDPLGAPPAGMLPDAGIFFTVAVWRTNRYAARRGSRGEGTETWSAPQGLNLDSHARSENPESRLPGSHTAATRQRQIRRVSVTR